MVVVCVCLFLFFQSDTVSYPARCKYLTVKITRLFRRAGRRNAPTPARTTTGTKSRLMPPHQTLEVRERKARMCPIKFVYVTRHRLLSTSGECKTQMRVRDQHNVWVEVFVHTTPQKNKPKRGWFRLLSTSGDCKTQMRVRDQHNVWVDISVYTTPCGASQKTN